MNFLRRKLEALGAAVAFAERGLWDESDKIVNGDRAAKRDGTEARTARQRPRVPAYRT